MQLFFLFNYNPIPKSVLLDWRRHQIKFSLTGPQEQLVSMFGYFFTAGAAAERFVHDPALWDELVGTGRADPAARWGLGGNAPVMASRFAREGAAVLLGAKLSPGLAEAAGEMQLAGGSVPEDDIHLILEYKVVAKNIDGPSPRD